jgi:hypothetical protein
MKVLVKEILKIKYNGHIKTMKEYFLTLMNVLHVHQVPKKYNGSLITVKLKIYRKTVDVFYFFMAMATARGYLYIVNIG